MDGDYPKGKGPDRTDAARTTLPRRARQDKVSDAVTGAEKSAQKLLRC